jgi:hypothetical protein
MDKTLYIKVFKMKSVNNLLFKGDKNMKILPLDAFYYNEFNKLYLYLII